ncbi:hypothetical protein M1432_02800 [Patescibacteria group bacterium]|nr:hypothetical protein [Patescibacteria group bacterium]
MEKNIEKVAMPEDKERKPLLKPEDLSNKLHDVFMSRKDVRQWLMNNERGRVTQEYLASIKNTVDTAIMMDGDEFGEQVAAHIKDDIDFNNRLFNNDKHETDFKIEADKFLDEAYIRPDEKTENAASTQEESIAN